MGTANLCAFLCIIELTEVEIKPFNSVDEQFAFEYGEGDRTLPSGCVTTGIFIHAGVWRSDVTRAKLCRLSFNASASYILDHGTHWNKPENGIEGLCGSK
jgi:hypothetical protein